MLIGPILLHPHFFSFLIKKASLLCQGYAGDAIDLPSLNSSPQSGLQDKGYPSYFTDKKTEVQRGEVITQDLTGRTKAESHSRL